MDHCGYLGHIAEHSSLTPIDRSLLRQCAEHIREVEGENHRLRAELAEFGYQAHLLMRKAVTNPPVPDPMLPESKVLAMLAAERDKAVKDISGWIAKRYGKGDANRVWREFRSKP